MTDGIELAAFMADPAPVEWPKGKHKFKRGKKPKPPKADCSICIQRAANGTCDAKVKRFRKDGSCRHFHNPEPARERLRVKLDEIRAERLNEGKAEPAAPNWHPDMKPFAILTDGTLTTDPVVIAAAREANMIHAEGLSLPSILTGGPFYQAEEIDGVLVIVPDRTVPGARSFPPFPGCYGINDLGPSRRF